MYYKLIETNTKGRDFVVSDLHGCYDLLMSNMKRVNFDTTKDRLFIVGDLIDRGTQNKECLSLLTEPYVFAIMGNHEYMLLNYINGIEVDLFLYNGGDWVLQEFYDYLLTVKPLLEQLPIMLETTVEGKSIGFVHADIKDWTSNKQILQDSDINSTDPFSTHNYETMSLLWSRTRISIKDTSPTTGIDLVFLGHTPLHEITTLSNNIYIDTGAVFEGGKMSFIEIKDYVKN